MNNEEIAITLQNETPPRETNRKRKMQETNDSITSEFIDLERMKIELLQNGMNNENNFDVLFFISIVPYMKDFSPMRKLRVTGKILLAKHYIRNRGKENENSISSSTSSAFLPSNPSSYP